MRRVLAPLISAVVLIGCVGMNEFASDVSSYSLWPADRKPSTYGVERLPSQQANPKQQQMLEDAARRAMGAAGFAPAADPQTADVSVTLGARVTAQDRSPYDDPFWWHGGLYGYRGFGRPFFYRGFGPHFGHPFYDTTYEREVAILIRDRKTGQPLYETHATNDGYSAAIDTLLPAMFEASMSDFPKGGVSPHRVVTHLKDK